MVFQWIVVLIAIITLVITVYSDSLTGKRKHSSYFQTVQKPTGKAERQAEIPNSSQHDGFYSKLNTL
jgi:hypothetical protein